MSHVHIIDADCRRRAALSRKILDLHFHAEIYEDYSEFAYHDVSVGLVMVAHTESRILLKLLQQGDIHLPVVVYEEEPDINDVVKAVQAGARDFLEWPASVERLRRVIECAEKGRDQMIARSRKRASARRLVALLSSRELDVLMGVVAGGSNKSIAEHLGISPRTVEIHRGHMMRKLEAGSTGDAVRIALYAGLDDEYEIAA